MNTGQESTYKDLWKCPKCGSRHTICHAGMFVDRFECLDCHWDWR